MFGRIRRWLNVGTNIKGHSRKYSDDDIWSVIWELYESFQGEDLNLRQRAAIRNAWSLGVDIIFRGGKA